MTPKNPVSFFYFRIQLFSLLLFYFLVLPMGLILLVKYAPEYLNQGQSVPSGGADPRISQMLSTIFRINMVGVILGFFFNLPFKNYIYRIRRGKKIPAGLKRFCRNNLLRIPYINALFLLLPFILSYGMIIFDMNFREPMDEITRSFFIQFLVISLIASLLVVLFSNYWHWYRVQYRYLSVFYSPEELKESIYRKKPGKIRNRLLVSSAMTTLLPLTIVIFYIFLSLSPIRKMDTSRWDQSHLSIIFGKYLNFFDEQSLSSLSSFFYVNAFDSILMLFGMLSGIIISVIYIIFFINWINLGITVQVEEVLTNMEYAGKGDLNTYSIVRTNDEIGRLAEGYNKMTQRLNGYIESIYRINEANARFVPEQFLNILGKKSISDIRIGDQTQREMTVMFADIRDFTTISERMTPKENFDFINTYLGFMEPVIRKNKGFIDKYMGDSIMALFPESASDAMKAGIMMIERLEEFND